MKKIPLLLAALLNLLFFVYATAGDPTSPGGHRPAFNPAVKQYVKDHVLPVLKEKRLLVEKELTTAEKDQLNTYRANLKQLHAQQKEVLQQKPEGITMREYMQSEEVKAKEHQTRQQMKTIMQQVQAIANNHLATLDNLHSQLEPAEKQWKEDIAKLLPARKQWREDSTRLEARRDAGDHPHGPAGMRPSFFEGHEGYAHFLLIPVQATGTGSTGDETLDELEAYMTDGGNTSGGIITTFQLSPNPASNELITGNEQIPSENQLKIVDMQGRTALTLNNIQPAQHIDVTQIPNGTYLVQFMGNGQSTENKIVISH